MSMVIHGGVSVPARGAPATSRFIQMTCDIGSERRKTTERADYLLSCHCNILLFFVYDVYFYCLIVTIEKAVKRNISSAYVYV